MAYIQDDRVKETTTTTGTGAVTLAGAVAGFQAFSAVMAVNDTCYYVIVSATGTDWETGTGTYSSASVLTRTTVLSSSNSGNAVNFSAGTKDVFMGPIANQVNDIAHGGTGATTAADARNNLGVSTGTVTSVSGTGTVSGLSLSGTVTSSGSLTLGGTLSAIPLATGVSGTLPVANGGTGVTTSTGTTNVVLSHSPTLVTPLSNTLSAVPVTVTSAGNALAVSAGNALTTGAGGNLTLTAGTGAGVGKGGDVILQPGAQGSSGGNGGVIVQTASGFGTTKFYSDGVNAANLYFSGNLNVSSNLAAGDFTTSSHVDTFYVRLNGSSYNAPVAIHMTNIGRVDWSSGSTNAANTGDTSLGRATTGVIKVSQGTVSTTEGGSLSFPSSLTVIAANTDNLPCFPSAFQRINCTSTSNLTGIAPPSGGTHVDGRMIRVYNVGTATLTLKHNVTSTAANLFFSTTGLDIVLITNAYAELIYDIIDNGRGGAGWRVR